jgi:hypothetical protein
MAAAGSAPGCLGGDDGGSVADVRSPRVGKPVVRGCSGRVEGGRVTPQPGRDRVIGPLAFVSLRDEYEAVARPDPRRSPPPAGFSAHPLKALVLLRAGVRVALVVPRPQRPWMQLLYDPSSVWLGSHRVTLEACRRQGYTQFSGSIYVDFGRAPRRARCARLIVRVDGRRRPLVPRLFDPYGLSCRSRARPPAKFEASRA